MSQTSRPASVTGRRNYPREGINFEDKGNLIIPSNGTHHVAITKSASYLVNIYRTLQYRLRNSVLKETDGTEEEENSINCFCETEKNYVDGQRNLRRYKS